MFRSIDKRPRAFFLTVFQEKFGRIVEQDVNEISSYGGFLSESGHEGMLRHEYIERSLTCYSNPHFISTNFNDLK